jgi:hypothetical protein
MVESASNHGCREFSVNVNAMLDALQDRGFILRYVVQGIRYIQVVNFEKHQRPHSNETPSAIPPHNQAKSIDRHKKLSTKVDSAVNQGEQRFGLIPDTGFIDSLIPDTGLLESADAPAADAIAPSKATTKRPTAMSEDWIAGHHLYEWGVGEGFRTATLDDETCKFRDHFIATGKPMKDWDAAWKNWMRRSREFASARASPSNGTRPKNTVAETLFSMARGESEQ